MTYILGISAYYHDSAAALIKDGDIVAAAQEERFSRKKHDARFPAAQGIRTRKYAPIWTPSGLNASSLAMKHCFTDW
jgi:carbamoyltransferase